jgi:hypothetical protein
MMLTLAMRIACTLLCAAREQPAVGELSFGFSTKGSAADQRESFVVYEIGEFLHVQGRFNDATSVSRTTEFIIMRGSPFAQL